MQYSGRYDRKKKSMAFFSRDRGKEVPKAVPPDKSVGAWPSVQEKTTGEENVRKSLCGGTTDDHQGVNEQENCRKHHDTLQQEDIPGKVSSRIMTSTDELMAQQGQQHNVLMEQHNVIMAQQHIDHNEHMAQERDMRISVKHSGMKCWR